MPEYIPRAEVPEGFELDDFTRAYLECAEWVGVDEEDAEAFELSVSPKWDAVSVRAALHDARDFTGSNEADLKSALDLHGYTEAQAGHDFFLTRNGHGAGFWDRGLGKIGDRLTADCKPYGEVYVFFDPETETLSLS